MDWEWIPVRWHRAWALSAPGLYPRLGSIRAWALSVPGLYPCLGSIRAWALSAPDLP